MYFCHEVLGYKDLEASVHYEIGQKLSKPFNRGLIMIPRKHLKTCQITIGWTIWMWLQNPNYRVGIGSATGDLTEEIVESIQYNITENPKFVAIFGSWYKKGNWTKTGCNIAPRTSGSKGLSLDTFSVGADPTGMHCDIIILDDVAQRKNSMSPEMRRKQIDLYFDANNVIVQDEVTWGEKGRDGIILAVGTRWHFGDLYNHLLTKMSKQMDFIIDRACVDNKTLEEIDPKSWRRDIKKVLNHPDSTVLFPQKNTLKSLMVKYRQVGTLEFSCQQMNYPVSSSTAAFKPEDLQFCSSQKVQGGLEHILLIDTAGDKSSYEKADDWASVVVAIEPIDMGYMKINRIYILDCIAQSKISSAKFLDIVALQCEKYGPTKIVIEKNFSKTYTNILKEKYPEIVRRSRIVEVRSIINKAYRILGLQPYVEGHNLYFVTDEEGKEVPFVGTLVKLQNDKDKLLDQISDYGSTEHDDCIDALANLLEVLTPPKSSITDPVYTYIPDNPKTGY